MFNKAPKIILPILIAGSILVSGCGSEAESTPSPSSNISDSEDSSSSITTEASSVSAEGTSIPDNSTEQVSDNVSDYDMTPYRTEWGNDIYGYVNLSDDWGDYNTIDADNSKMLQYAYKENDVVYIVTLTADTNTADNTMNAIIETDAGNDKVIELSRESVGDLEKDGAHFNLYMSLEAQDDYTTLCTICCIDRKESPNMHYFAFEGLVEGENGLEKIDTDKYTELFSQVFQSYSETQILDKYHATISESILENSTTP